MVVVVCQAGWPDMVAKEVSESVQNFVSHVQIAQGVHASHASLGLTPVSNEDSYVCVWWLGRAHQGHDGAAAAAGPGPGAGHRRERPL